MPLLLELLMIVIVPAVLAAIVIGVARMNRAGGRGRGSVGNLMTDLDAMLQPHHPTAEVIQKAKDGEAEHDDEGDDKDPDRKRNRLHYGPPS